MTRSRLPSPRLRRAIAAAFGAGALAAPAPATLHAQPPTGAPPARGTGDGVYTSAQADRGADVYAGFCKSCHAATAHAGVTFANAWRGRPLSELFAYVSEKMPKNDPGGLAADQYADVVAYLLKLNAQPTGRAELPADASALTGIRITLPDGAAGSGSGAPRR